MTKEKEKRKDDLNLSKLRIGLEKEKLILRNERDEIQLFICPKRRSPKERERTDSEARKTEMR